MNPVKSERKSCEQKKLTRTMEIPITYSWLSVESMIYSQM